MTREVQIEEEDLSVYLGLRQMNICVNIGIILTVHCTDDPWCVWPVKYCTGFLNRILHESEEIVKPSLTIPVSIDKWMRHIPNGYRSSCRAELRLTSLSTFSPTPCASLSFTTSLKTMFKTRIRIHLHFLGYSGTPLGWILLTPYSWLMTSSTPEMPDCGPNTVFIPTHQQTGRRVDLWALASRARIIF